MFTSATERTAFAYLLSAILTALFGSVYEIFSHGVWSGWMVYAFAFPLLLGALPFAWMSLRRRSQPAPWCRRLHHAGVATLTVGSVMQGVLTIYGTTNRLIVLYWVAGCLLLAASQLCRTFRK